MRRYSCLIVPWNTGDVESDNLEHDCLLCFLHEINSSSTCPQQQSIQIECKTFRYRDNSVIILYVLELPITVADTVFRQNGLLVNFQQYIVYSYPHLTMWDPIAKKNVVCKKIQTSLMVLSKKLERNLRYCNCVPTIWYAFNAIYFSGNMSHVSVHTLYDLIKQHHKEFPMADIPRFKSFEPFIGAYMSTISQHNGVEHLMRYVTGVEEICISSLGFGMKIHRRYNEATKICPDDSTLHANMLYMNEWFRHYDTFNKLVGLTDEALETNVESFVKNVCFKADESIAPLIKMFRQNIKMRQVDLSKDEGYVGQSVLANKHLHLTFYELCRLISPIGYMEKTPFRTTITDKKCARIFNENRYTIAGRNIKNDMKHLIPINIPVLTEKQGLQYLYNLITNISALDGPFMSTQLKELATKVYLYGTSKSFQHFQREIRTKANNFAEMICPNYPIYAVSIDIDSRDVSFVTRFMYTTRSHLKTKQNLTKENYFLCARLEFRQSLVKMMRKYLKTWIGVPDSHSQFRCTLYESCMDENGGSLNYKVGFHVVFRFHRLAFLNTNVVHSFIAGYKFIVERDASSILPLDSIDLNIYKDECHTLRLPMSYKDLVNGRPSRVLIPIISEDPQTSPPTWIPSYGMVHLRHSDFDVVNGVMITDLPNILMTEQYKNNRAEHIHTMMYTEKNQLSQNRISGRTALAEEDYISDIIGKMAYIKAQILSSGGGRRSEVDQLHPMKISVGQYCLGAIHYCVNRQHINPDTNKCFYNCYVYNSSEGLKYSVIMRCFGDCQRKFVIRQELLRAG